MAFIGVRISWLTFETNSFLARAACATSSRARSKVRRVENQIARGAVQLFPEATPIGEQGHQLTNLDRVEWPG